MNHTDTIKALRDALTECRNYLSDFYANAKVRGAEAAHKNAFKMQQVADNALALTADASEDAPDADTVHAWFARKSEFGPWLECSPSTTGAQVFYSGPKVQRVLAARPAPVAATPAPAGWQLVPTTLTDDMVIAFMESWVMKVRCIDDPEMDDAYAAMLAVAPAAPIAEVTAVGVVVADDRVHGWHMQPLKAWEAIGAGTKLYTHPAASHAKPEPVERQRSPYVLGVKPCDWDAQVTHAKLAEGASERFSAWLVSKGKSPDIAHHRDEWAAYQAGQQAGAVDGETS